MATEDAQSQAHDSPPNATGPSAQQITILNQYIDEHEGVYRAESGGRVYYLTIAADVFDEDTMSRPYLLVPKLPSFPNEDWTKMRIQKSSDGNIDVTVSNDALPSLTNIWHDQFVDVLTLERKQRFNSSVHEVLYQGRPAIAKIAPFEWEISRLAKETWAYCLLTQHYQTHSAESPISPRVLAHITEDGRVTGILLERIQGGFASIGNLQECEDVLRKLHSIGLVHGDVNRYNFIIEDSSGLVRLVDFEHAQPYETQAAQTELSSLPAELCEETGRGRAVLI